MRIRLDRTLCDGFGICAKHAPQHFSLDDWGYASLIGDGSVPPENRDVAMRALLDCPAHAITEVPDEDTTASDGRIADPSEGHRRPGATTGGR